MKPLSGIRVIDLTRLLPGPLATLLLSDLGAEVIKVEEPGGDPLRGIPPIVGEASALFHALNRGKRFVTADLKSQGGRDRLLRLLEGADCLVEGYRPGVLPRLRLDPAELVARFDRLVVVRISGFGQHGPWAERPGHDLGYMALSGALDGAPEPWPLPVQVADVGGAMLAVSSVLAALVGRERGRPIDRVLDVPLLDAALLAAFPAHARQSAGDDVRPGRGLLEGGLSTYRLYRDAGDRAVAVAALEPGPIAALASFAGGTDTEVLVAAFAAVSGHALSESGALPPSVEPVLSLSEARRHPAVQARSLFRPMNFEGGEVLLPVTPFAAGDPTPPGPWARPPGADDEALLPGS